jgi:hypothetical protein
MMASSMAWAARCQWLMGSGFGTFAGRPLVKPVCGSVQRRDVRSVVVHVVAVAHLSGPAVAAPIVRDDAIAQANEEQGLAIPIVTAERPAMVEHDWLGVRADPNLSHRADPILSQGW